MQRGCLAIITRKEGTTDWQFRWSEKDLHESRVQRKRVLGTVERYPYDPVGNRTQGYRILQGIRACRQATTPTTSLRQTLTTPMGTPLRRTAWATRTTSRIT